MELSPKNEVEDAEIERLARLAKYGDADAGFLLHSHLASRLDNAALTGFLSPAIAKFLSDMHAGIAHGNSAKSAMLMSAPASRPIQAVKKGMVFAFVVQILDFFSYTEENRADMEGKGVQLPRKKIAMAEVYRITAAAFKLSPERVKGIYAEELERIKENG